MKTEMREKYKEEENKENVDVDAKREEAITCFLFAQLTLIVIEVCYTFDGNNIRFPC